MTDLPDELLIKLINLGFTEDFSILGISPQDAMKLDMPFLQRLINEKTGVVDAFNAKKEQETQEANKKFFEEMANRNRILF